jgi:hypothetical protein
MCPVTLMFKVCVEKCDQCLFSLNKIVSDDRRAEILEECKSKDSHFICHKATLDGQNLCCRGFYDTQTSQLIRIAGRLNCIEFVPVPTPDTRGCSE